MRAHQVRTSRTTQAVIVGVGLASALGTAAAIGVSTLTPTGSENAGSPATSTSRTTTQRTHRLHSDEADDQGRGTRVTAPPTVAKTRPAPQATSSGS
jgi:hypothetical protein